MAAGSSLPSSTTLWTSPEEPNLNCHTCRLWGAPSTPSQAFLTGPHWPHVQIICPTNLENRGRGMGGTWVNGADPVPRCTRWQILSRGHLLTFPNPRLKPSPFSRGHTRCSQRQEGHDGSLCTCWSATKPDCTLAFRASLSTALHCLTARVPPLILRVSPDFVTLPALAPAHRSHLSLHISTTS